MRHRSKISKNLYRTASMSCLTSASVSFDPSRANPVFSSSYVIVPLLSVSMFANIAFKPWISSSDMFSAITCFRIAVTKLCQTRHFPTSIQNPWIKINPKFPRQGHRLKGEQCTLKQIKMKITFNASFFNLFIALNCFILERTALSIGLSDAFPPSLIHGWSS